LDHCEVAIVGAGVHGASAAFHLSSRGVRVAIFDQRGPAGGPTGRSSAICRAYYTNEFLAELAKRSIEMLADFDDVVGGTAGFKRTGFLWLHPARDVADLEKTVRRLARAGVAVDRLDPAEVARDHPQFNLDGVATALWERDAGYADPTLTTTSLISRAVQLGAETNLYSKVVSLVKTAGGFVVENDKGHAVHATKVLLAAGPWTRQLALMVGADLPLTVERHVVAVIRWQASDRMRFGHADLISGQYYCKPEGENMYCLGPLLAAENADPDSFDEALGSEEGFALTQAVASRVPAFREAELVGGWASLYDVSPDWQPVIGEIAQGVFVDAGTSGHGFKLAPALGAVVADMIMGAADPRLAQFHPRRFGAGHTLEAGYGTARILG
jgi:glycine/D-amino acid oxidase-like deaminating enzyme